MSKKMMSMLLTLLFTCIAFFGLPCSEHAIQTRVRRMLSSSNACIIIARMSVESFSEVCRNFGTLPMFGPSRIRIRPDTRVQIKGLKRSAHPRELLEMLYTDFQDMIFL
jgi:hypothetical protein